MASDGAEKNSRPSSSSHYEAILLGVAEDLGRVELRGVGGQDVVDARRGQVEGVAVDVGAGRERGGEERDAVVAQLAMVDVGAEVLGLAGLAVGDCGSSRTIPPALLFVERATL